MNQTITDLSCARFAEALAAKQSVPGGGAAAAYVGALAIALCSMVGNFTTGKQAYAQVEGDIECLLAKSEEVRIRLVGLVDEDARAFEPLARAYGIPKDDPSRAAVLEQATKDACAAPLEMMRQIAGAIDLLEEMGEKGSRLLVSDVGCGAALAAGALQAAAMNVFVNTQSLADRVWAEGIEGEARSLLEAVPRAQALAESLLEQMGGAHG